MSAVASHKYRFPISGKALIAVMDLIEICIEGTEHDHIKSDLESARVAIQKLPTPIASGNIIFSVGKSYPISGRQRGLSNAWAELEMTSSFIELRRGGHVYEAYFGGDSFSEITYECDSDGGQNGDLAEWLREFETLADGECTVRVSGLETRVNADALESRTLGGSASRYFQNTNPREWQQIAALAQDNADLERAMNRYLAATIKTRKKYKDDAEAKAVIAGIVIVFVIILGVGGANQAAVICFGLLAAFPVIWATIDYCKGLCFGEALDELGTCLIQSDLQLDWLKDQKYPNVRLRSRKY